MTPRLRGAILGFGNVAEHGHLPAWLARDDAHIAAVVEPDAERRARARALLPDTSSYRDLAAALRGEELDFVDIAMPPALHAAAIEEAAGAGLHVLCEKPLVVTPAELARVRDASRRSGVALFTVHNWKHSEPFRRVRELVSGGVLGPLTGVKFETVRDGCSQAVGDQWRMRSAVAGGGILVDHGWHAFYLIPVLVGERPLSIRARLARRRYLSADVEDSASCAIEFPTLSAELELTWAGSERRTSWRLVGRDGEVELGDARLRLFRRGRACEEVECAESLSAGSHHPEWFGAVIDEFRREIGLPGERGANLAEAGQCIDLLAAAYRSDASGGHRQELQALHEAETSRAARP